MCEEEPYLLELVRYIHLNPLRAGLVGDVEGLDVFPWSGHAVIVGNRVRATLRCVCWGWRASRWVACWGSAGLE